MVELLGDLVGVPLVLDLEARLRPAVHARRDVVKLALRRREADLQRPVLDVGDRHDRDLGAAGIGDVLLLLHAHDDLLSVRRRR
eukprot:6080319-Prymnesium_polylepis.2